MLVVTYNQSIQPSYITKKHMCIYKAIVMASPDILGECLINPIAMITKEYVKDGENRQ